MAMVETCRQMDIASKAFTRTERDMVTLSSNVQQMVKSRESGSKTKEKVNQQSTNPVEKSSTRFTVMAHKCHLLKFLFQQMHGLVMESLSK